MKNRTTAVARAVDSSQFVGNCEFAIASSSVWPSTTIGWSNSVRSSDAIRSSSGDGRRARSSGGLRSGGGRRGGSAGAGALALGLRAAHGGRDEALELLGE